MRASASAPVSPRRARRAARSSTNQVGMASRRLPASDLGGPSLPSRPSCWRTDTVPPSKSRSLTASPAHSAQRSPPITPSHIIGASSGPSALARRSRSSALSTGRSTNLVRGRRRPEAGERANNSALTAYENNALRTDAIRPTVEGLYCRAQRSTILCRSVRETWASLFPPITGRMPRNMLRSRSTLETRFSGLEASQRSASSLTVNLPAAGAAHVPRAISDSAFVSHACASVLDA